ncbi:hypothetical protein ZIOFF_060972 [Zingiber officinale]|uniref:Uncharacterized protein n=1 Tax=Zingiber officinale TaxID=94328 RepID=A0A8J5FBG1_ZINOF|nr:hypothetical protein ZIOFF_060972 [Zingiber officinale]
MNFLRDECGISEERISIVLKSHPGFFVQKPDSFRPLVDRADGIGIPQESKMFIWILDVLPSLKGSVLGTCQLNSFRLEEICLLERSKAMFSSFLQTELDVCWATIG